MGETERYFLMRRLSRGTWIWNTRILPDPETGKGDECIGKEKEAGEESQIFA